MSDHFTGNAVLLGGKGVGHMGDRLQQVTVGTFEESEMWLINKELDVLYAKRVVVGGGTSVLCNAPGTNGAKGAVVGVEGVMDEPHWGGSSQV
jgi:hypothetical protein